jgi:SAM-dependent methyltransferase
MTIYDRIGKTYGRTRRTDPRLADALWSALGPGRTLLNVGAGTGSYEPVDRTVVAVEPSLEMIRQRRSPHDVVRSVAESLPFRDGAFDTAMAILTMHHWSDPGRGLLELRRVSRRQIVWYCTALDDRSFWSLEYFSSAAGTEPLRNPPGEALLRQCLDIVEIRPLLIPHDCSDGFGVAFWARPEAYLDPLVQAGMSCLATLPPAVRRAGAQRLAADLASGAWDRRYGHLRRQRYFDGGFRIAIAQSGGPD